MTYFRTGCRTIIGAVSFHGPVRDGKGWGQRAMVARNSVSCPPHWEAARTRLFGGDRRFAGLVHCLGAFFGRAQASLLQSYRVKPHGQLVLVS